MSPEQPMPAEGFLRPKAEVLSDGSLVGLGGAEEAAGEAAALADTLGQHIGDALEIDANPQTVPVNVFRTTESLVVVAPLPGVMAEDVHIEIEGTRLTLRAAMRTSAPKDYLVHEWHYGPYERTIEIPEGFGGDASASFGNGQLALRVGRGPTSPGPRTVTPAD